MQRNDLGGIIWGVVCLIFCSIGMRAPAAEPLARQTAVLPPSSNDGPETRPEPAGAQTLAQRSTPLVPNPPASRKKDAASPSLPNVAPTDAASGVRIEEMQATRSKLEVASGLDLWLTLSGSAFEKAARIRYRIAKAVDDTGADLRLSAENDSSINLPGQAGQLVRLKLPVRKALVLKEFSGSRRWYSRNGILGAGSELRTSLESRASCFRTLC
jgi:hypothetical protein